MVVIRVSVLNPHAQPLPVVLPYKNISLRMEPSANQEMSPPVPPPAPRSWNALTAPGTFTEGDSLRRVENLPQFTPNLQPRDIAFIKYSTSRNHNEETEQSDNCGEEYSIGKIADLDHLGPEDFPPEKDFTPTPDTDKLVRVM